MNVNINAVHFKADKKLEAFIQQKVEKLSAFYDGIIGSEVSLKLSNQGDRDNKITEIRLIIRGYDLFAKKQSNTFEESTDQAVEALRRQLSKYKEKSRKKY
jgi:putative sigma-54 modulation protein